MRAGYAGCWLHSYGDVKGALGSDPLENGLYAGLGNTKLDNIMAPEVDRLMRYFGAVVGVFSNPDNNAFATPQRLQNSVRPDGTVVMGRQLIAEVTAKFSRQPSMGTHAIVGIFAHEFGHIAYYKSGLNMPRGKFPELHADFMSGWYTGIRSSEEPGNVNVNEIKQEMFDIGDTNYQSPMHHGTPDERQNSFLAGVSLASRMGTKASLAVAFNQGLQYLQSVPSLKSS